MSTPRILTRVADFSSGPPRATSLVSAGFTGTIRYLRKRTPSSVSVLTPAELAANDQAHLNTALVYEDAVGSWMNGGWDTGLAVGQWCRMQCAALSINPRCIYFAADMPGMSTVLVNSCLRALATQLPPSVIGIYGFLPVLQAARPYARWFWLCGSQSGVQNWMHVYQWNNGNTQVDGITCDIDYVYQQDYGQLHAPANPSSRTSRATFLVND